MFGAGVGWIGSMELRCPTGVVAPLVFLTAMAEVVPSALAQSFNPMGFVPPRLGSYVYGLSADGTVAAGFDDGTAAIASASPSPRTGLARRGARRVESDRSQDPESYLCAQKA